VHAHGVDGVRVDLDDSERFVTAARLQGDVARAIWNGNGRLLQGWVSSMTSMVSGRVRETPAREVLRAAAAALVGR